MPSVMEKPSAGSGILSRSRAKTAPNGGQPHSEDDSSEEEHSHGEPRGLGLKAHSPGGGRSVGAGRGRVVDHGRIILMIPAPPWIGASALLLKAWSCRHGDSGGWAPSC